MLRALTATTAGLGPETANKKSSSKLGVYEFSSYIAPETAQIDFEITCASESHSATLSKLKLVRNTV